MFSKCKTTQYIIMYLVIILLEISTIAFGFSAEVAKTLTNYMYPIKKNVSDKNMRPAVNQMHPTDLQVFFHLIS